jgi:hypothetical protein
VSKRGEGYGSEDLLFAKIGSAGHFECAAVVKRLRHTATAPEQP